MRWKGGGGGGGVGGFGSSFTETENSFDVNIYLDDHPPCYTIEGKYKNF